MEGRPVRVSRRLNLITLVEQFFLRLGPLKVVLAVVIGVYDCLPLLGFVQSRKVDLIDVSLCDFACQAPLRVLSSIPGRGVKAVNNVAARCQALPASAHGRNTAEVPLVNLRRFGRPRVRG